MGKVPVKKRWSKSFNALPSAVTKGEADFYRCPKGHKLPHKTEWGECMPVYCAAEGKVKASSLKRADPETRLAAADENEKAHIELAKKRRQSWYDELQVPRGISGADAEKWIDDKMMALGVDAVATMEEFVKYGTPEQRQWAAGRILDGIGKGKKEAGMQVVSPIVILSNDPKLQALPWSTKQVKVIDAQVVPVDTTEKK